LGERRRARECALQMLYQIDQTEVTAEEVFGQFWHGQQQAGEDVRAFAERLVGGVIARREQLDKLIAEAAEHWKIGRMAVVDRNVLRLAVYEMLDEGDTPPAVIIDEAIEISKKFGSEDSGNFINCILDAVRKRLEVPPASGTD